MLSVLDEEPRMTVTIRHTTPADETRWRELWAGYCAFYQVSLGDQVTTQTWLRIMDPASQIHCIVACDAAGRVQGIANYILHDNTWTLTPVCYLEDLFVDPVVRGRQFGKALIDWLVAQAKAQGWSRLYWMTREDNATARRLYDRYTPRDQFIRYLLRP